MVETQPERLRAAVIGVGYLGRIHARKYLRLPGVELVGVADHDPERAAAVAAELGVEWHADPRELRGRVDLASICVSTPAHFATASEWLDAGVHLLVEKPITTTLEEADRLIALAAARGVILQVGLLKRFHPAVVALRESGLISAPRLIEGQRLAPFKERALDVDVILDLMIHDIDLALAVVSSEVVGVEAVGMAVFTSRLDHVRAWVRFANGCVADLTAARGEPETVRRMRIFQAGSDIAIDFAAQRVSVRRTTAEPPRLVGGGEVRAVVVEELPVVAGDTLEAELGAFCGAVRERRPPVVDGQAGRRALEVVMAVQRACATGRDGWVGR